MYIYKVVVIVKLPTTLLRDVIGGVKAKPYSGVKKSR